MASLRSRNIMDIEESKSSCDLEQHEHEFYSQPESQMAYPKKMGEQNLEELKHQSEPSDSYSKSSTGITMFKPVSSDDGYSCHTCIGEEQPEQSLEGSMKNYPYDLEFFSPCDEEEPLVFHEENKAVETSKAQLLHPVNYYLMSNYIMPAVEKITLEAPEIQKSLNNLILKGKNYTSSFPEWVDQTRTNKITPSEEGSLHMIKDAEVCQIRRKVYSKECQVSSLLNFPSIISLCNSMLIEKPHPKVSLVSWELCRTINKKQKDFAHKITKKAMSHFFSSIQTNFVINDMISSDDKKVLKLMIWQLKFDLSCNRQSLGWEQTLQNGKKYRVRCRNINPKVLKKTIADYIEELNIISIFIYL